MNYIFVNCEKLPFGKTLGVSHFVLELCNELRKNFKIIFVVESDKEFVSSDVGQFINSVAEEIVVVGKGFEDFEVSKHMQKGSKAIELLPHHFQPPRFSIPSILICHDLHVFDIPWKYNNVEQVKSDFRKNLISADVVISEFPRTYYDVEHIAGITLPNLYLTESPLLLDTKECIYKKEKNDDLGVLDILFPAQLQRHKNHESLIKALFDYKELGFDANLYFPGSDFDTEYKKKLLKLIKNLNLSDNVRFLGRISDKEVVDLYCSCDGVIVPSLAEGGAYVPFEAIAAGKPVAINRINSATQHIKMVKGNVHWFDSTNITETTEAIQYIAKCKTDCSFDINREAREKIEHMSWKIVSDKYKMIIDWLLGNGTKPTLLIDKDGWNIEYS